jgi:hypothetical protein
MTTLLNDPEMSAQRHRAALGERSRAADLEGDLAVRNIAAIRVGMAHIRRSSRRFINTVFADPKKRHRLHFGGCVA